MSARYRFAPDILRKLLPYRERSAFVLVPVRKRAFAAPQRQNRTADLPPGDAVSMILILEAGAAEVEVKLPGRYKVSPQIAGALKAVPGVIEVQAV